MAEKSRTKSYSQVKTAYLSLRSQHIIEEPVNNVRRNVSLNYNGKNHYGFYKTNKKVNFFSEIYQIVMKVIIYLYVNIKILHL